MFFRLFTGDDGQSHFEELDMEDGPMGWGKTQDATGMVFRTAEPGNFMDWHTAPRRQYIITLSGEVEIGIADGTKKRFGPGDVMLADDTTGQGHTTHAVSDVPRVSVAIPID